MKCKAVIREIEELERSAAPSVEAEAHLLSCEPCRVFADERASLRMLVGSLENVSAPADFDWRLRARLAEARSERAVTRRFLPGFTPGAQAITVAASVTLLLVAVVVYRQTRPLPSNKTLAGAIAGANTKQDAGKENESKGTPGVNTPEANPRGSAPASAPDNKQQSAPNETPRPRAIKSAKANAARTEAARESAPQRIFSNDLASRGAEDLTSRKPGGTSTGSAPVISVGVPSATSAQLRFEDGQGTRRTLSPVNFGGQQLIERSDKVRLVSASEKGIW